MIKCHFVYQIKNLVNSKIYVGKHSTYKVEDNYMGSSNILKLAFNKYGEDNFKRTILKFFKTPEEAFEYERKIVTPEFCSRPDTYNLVEGGGSSANTGGLCVVEHKSSGIKTMIPTELLKDSNEFESIHKGYLTIRDENSITGYSRIKRKDYNPDTMKALSSDQVTIIFNDGKTKCLPKNQFDKNSKDYKHINRGKVNARLKDGTIKRVSTKEFHDSGLVGNTKGFGSYRLRKTDETIFTSTNDPRIEIGEIVGMFSNRVNAKLEDGSISTVSKEEFYLKGLKGNRSGQVSVKDSRGNTFSVAKIDPRYLSGKLAGVNSGSHGKRRITNGTINKMLKSGEKLPEGWRYCKPRKGENGFETK